MKLPVMRGLIERRMLVNYRVEPRVLASLLPEPFRPKTVRGVGMAGICLIRLKRVRPGGVPAWLGMASENAAHRIAVEWEDEEGVREGVYVRRRDTSSRINAWAGGRLFPGVHHHATFTVAESAERCDVALRSDDGATEVAVAARSAARLPSSSVFASLEEASAFFRGGAVGYSPAREPGRFQGLELRCAEWKVDPLEVEAVRSSFFDDASLFPKKAIEFDCALLMRDVEHAWHSVREKRQAATPVFARG